MNEYKFVLNEYETAFLKAFWEKQKPGSPDNDLTTDAIHVVERNNREWVECESGDTWIDYDNEYKEYSSFAGLIDARIEKGEELPRYEDVLYERVNDVFIADAHDYIEAYGINAYSGNWIDVWCPVAFFFIREEARKYMDGYQRHNCIGCRIYTYSLGNHNQGDLPVFRDMLLRMGEELTELEKEYDGVKNSLPQSPSPTAPSSEGALRHGSINETSGMLFSKQPGRTGDARASDTNIPGFSTSEGALDVGKATKEE